MEKELDHLLASKVLAVAHAINQDDDALLKLTVAGIMAIPNVGYAQLTRLDKPNTITLGTRPKNSATAARVVYTIKEAVPVKAGVLTIGISFDRAEIAFYDRLQSSLLAGLFALVAMWIGLSLIFRRVIDRPLAHLRDAIQGWNSGRQIDILHSDGDGVIGEVLTAFEELQSERTRYEKALIEIRADLETRVRERTAELTEARDRAERASRARSDFLAAVSHEIRTPMNAILGIAQSLSGELAEDRHRGQVQTLLESGRVLTSLLDDILDQAKIEADHMTIEPVRADIRRLIETVSALWRPLCESKGLTLEVRVDPSVPQTLRFDPVRVRQCLVNLLSNANKFTERGGIQIKASAAEAGAGRVLVSLSVEDTGPGIEKHLLPQLFEPFSQGDSTTTRRFGGSGLGLAICKSLSKLMGGDISVETLPGEGSSFTFTFEAGTVADAAAAAPAEPVAMPVKPGQELDLNGKRVLVVDDVATNRFIVRLLLSATGAAVEEVADGVAAIEKLHTASYDLVILDIHMPVIDGYETLSRMRALGGTAAGVPVIAFTADVEETNRRRLEGSGIDGYLAKPIDFRAALTEIRRVLDRAASGV